MKNTMELQQRNRFSVSISRKINLGNYESADVFISVASDEEQSIDTMLDSCQEKVEARCNQLYENWGNKN